MTSLDECAFRSEHPDVLAMWERIASTEWADKIREYGIAIGLPDGEFSTFGRDTFAGFTPPARAADVPAGWRVAKVTRRGLTERYMLPDKRTKAGKAAERWFEELGRRPYLSDIPGIPGKVLDRRSSLMRNPEAFCHNGAVYVRFNVPVAAIEDRSPGYTAFGEYNPDMWATIKLSEYHAALEAETEERSVA